MGTYAFSVQLCSYMSDSIFFFYRLLTLNNSRTRERHSRYSKCHWRWCHSGYWPERVPCSYSLTGTSPYSRNRDWSRDCSCKRSWTRRYRPRFNSYRGGEENSPKSRRQTSYNHLPNLCRWVRWAGFLLVCFFLAVVNDAFVLCYGDETSFLTLIHLQWLQRSFQQLRKQSSPRRRKRLWRTTTWNRANCRCFGSRYCQSDSHISIVLSPCICASIVLRMARRYQNW